LTIFTHIFLSYFSLFYPSIPANYNNLEPISKWASTTKLNSSSSKNSPLLLLNKSFAAFWTLYFMIKAPQKHFTKQTCQKSRRQHSFLPALWCKTCDKVATRTPSSLKNHFQKAAKSTFPSMGTMRRTLIHHCFKA
jgi:hypothetical protein